MLPVAVDRLLLARAETETVPRAGSGPFIACQAAPRPDTLADNVDLPRWDHWQRSPGV
jgi:hypothetical protein